MLYSENSPIRKTMLMLGAAVLAGGPTLLAQSIQPRMGEPVPGLTSAQKARFDAGKVVFGTALTAATGLGPGFNDTNCAHCHLAPASGGSSSVFVTRFGKAASGSNPFDPLANLGGSLLQAQTISPSCQEFVPAQANVNIHRVTPPTFGFGLVEAIDDADIIYNSAFPPPGVNGMVHMVHALEDPPLAQDRAGRFGWKAQVATILTFSGDASLNEMGLTNRLVQTENAPNGDAVLLAACDSVADPEDHADAQGVEMIDRMTDFQKFLAPPPQTPKSGMSGETIFNSIGCAACHLSTPFNTNAIAEAPLANKTLKPYSDFLLHSMGSLGDGIVQGQATELQFRTPPLWGVSHRGNVVLLHDGRISGGTFSQNIDGTILLHDGEALAARNAYAALSPTQKSQLASFLESLGRAEFDFENNNNVDEFDWFFLQPFLNGPVAAYTPDSTAAVADIDQDGDFDLRDFGMMQRAFTGP